jgi:hypothetical protein
MRDIERRTPSPGQRGVGLGGSGSPGGVRHGEDRPDDCGKDFLIEFTYFRNLYVILHIQNDMIESWLIGLVLKPDQKL